MFRKSKIDLIQVKKSLFTINLEKFIIQDIFHKFNNSFSKLLKKSIFNLPNIIFFEYYWYVTNFLF
jgi:hypothetical protein